MYCQENSYGEAACCSDERLNAMFLLAQKARLELIKDKLKQKLDEAEGRKYEKAAELIVSAIMDHRKGESEKANRFEEIQKEFDAIFKGE